MPCFYQPQCVSTRFSQGMRTKPDANAFRLMVSITNCLRIPKFYTCRTLRNRLLRPSRSAIANVFSSGSPWMACANNFNRTFKSGSRRNLSRGAIPRNWKSASSCFHSSRLLARCHRLSMQSTGTRSCVLCLNSVQHVSGRKFSKTRICNAAPAADHGQDCKHGTSGTR